MKLLVLATDYPSANKATLYYIHTRNKYYVKCGMDVTVLNFSALKAYVLDDVSIITLKDYKKIYKSIKYDLLISHAPNIRNHYIFLKKYGKNFKNIVFFYHGHEVLDTTLLYPKPYNYINKARATFINSQKVYDKLKLIIWRRYLKKIYFKVQLIFVSNWMKAQFFNNIPVEVLFKNKTSTIYNSVGEIFEKEKYHADNKKVYDFVTIRPYLDESKYGIDIVNFLAIQNPHFKFCIVGKGQFYHYNIKPKNVYLIEKELNHEEIVQLLNQSKYALMPTRLDAQGVMACEMATFGIPLVTSNLPVCKEVFSKFNNVCYINNENPDLRNVKCYIKKVIKVEKYYKCNTIDKEIQLFKDILKVE